MGADNLSQLFSCVNAAYVVHHSLKIHTGGYISLSYGLVHCMYNNKELNMKNSTWEDVVGKQLPTIQHCICLFMESQGYGIK